MNKTLHISGNIESTQKMPQIFQRSCTTFKSSCVLKIRDLNVVWSDRQIKIDSFIYIKIKSYASKSLKLIILFLQKHSHGYYEYGFSYFRHDLNIVLIFDIGFTTYKLSKMSSTSFLFKQKLKKYLNWSWTQFWFNIWNLSVWKHNKSDWSLEIQRQGLLWD